MTERRSQVASRAGSESVDLVTMTISVDRQGGLKSDVQTHDNSYAEVAVGLAAVKREIERVFEERRSCPFYPANAEQARSKILRTTPIAPAAAAEPSELTTCNCRWKGEKLVQQCTLHEAWRDAIRDWSERAKVAERQLPDRERAASLVAGEDTKRLDFLQGWAEKAKFLGHKWDTFMFDFVKHTTIREAIDAARASAGEAQS